MLIKLMTYDSIPYQNDKLEAGDMDGQIRADIAQLVKDLETKMDMLKENLAAEDLESTRRRMASIQSKLDWANRLLALLSQTENTHDVPEELTEDAWQAMDPRAREFTVRGMANKAVQHIRDYFPETVYVEKQSFHPEDWYLWSVAACRDDGGRPGDWDAWTLNLTTGSLSGGRYGLTTQSLKTVLAEKKSVAICDTKTCSLAREIPDYDTQAGPEYSD